MDYFNNEEKGEKIIIKQEKVNTKKIIYLGGLPPDVDKYELDQFIKKQGDFHVEEMMTKNSPKPFAYIKFKTKDEAQEALKALHLKEFNNYIIKAEPFKSSKNKEPKKQNIRRKLTQNSGRKRKRPKNFGRFTQQKQRIRKP